MYIFTLLWVSDYKYVHRKELQLGREFASFFFRLRASWNGVIDEFNEIWDIEAKC